MRQSQEQCFFGFPFISDSTFDLFMYILLLFTMLSTYQVDMSLTIGFVLSTAGSLYLKLGRPLRFQFKFYTHSALFCLEIFWCVKNLHFTSTVNNYLDNNYIYISRLGCLLDQGEEQENTAPPSERPAPPSSSTVPKFAE